MTKKPNILVLYCDQHSARCLGCYGNDEVYTPNLDRLASEGVMMDSSFCNNPICTPSRMAMLSGQYVHNFGYWGLMGRKPERLPNMFEYFREKGYRNGVVGKIHTPAQWVSQNCDFVRDGYGYEIPLNMKNRDIAEGCQGTANDCYQQWLDANGVGGDRDDKVLHEVREKYGWNWGQGVDARPSRLPAKYCFENWCANETIDFIEQAHRDDKPFFMWMTLPRPHETYCPSREYWDMYEGRDLTLPPNSEDDMSTRDCASKRKQKGFQENGEWTLFEPRDWESARKRVLRGYYGCVTQSDAAFGRVLDKLEELGIKDDTIIVYTADHGEFAGEHGMIEKAPGIGYQCVTRVPMIWRYPGIEKGGKRHEVVESVDIFPTICSLAGIEMPNWVDGVDATPVIKDDTPIKDIAVTENANTKTLHTKKWNFVQFLPEFHEGKDFGELYDRENDPYELHNLYFEPEYQNVVQDLRYKLYCWLVRNTRSVSVSPTIPMPDVSDNCSAWEFAEDLGVCDRDGKVGRTFYEYMMGKNSKLYI